MNARYSSPRRTRRRFLAAGAAGAAAIAATMVDGMIPPSWDGPSWRLDLDHAEARLATLRADHHAGIDTAAGFATLASELARAATMGDWTSVDQRRVRSLAADACSAAGGTAWGQAEESQATAWASCGQTHASVVGDLDTFVRLETTKALSRTFDPYPTPANALISLDIATHTPSWPVVVPVSARTQTLVEVHRAYAHALLARRGETGSAYQANAAWDRAGVQAELAGDPGLVGWVAHGVWATLVGLSGGKVGDAGPLLPILERELATISTVRGQAGLLVAIACQAVVEGDDTVAGQAAGRVVELADKVGYLPLDRREARRLLGIARWLLDRDAPTAQAAGVLVWRSLNGTGK